MKLTASHDGSTVTFTATQGTGRDIEDADRLDGTGRRRKSRQDSTSGMTDSKRGLARRA